MQEFKPQWDEAPEFAMFLAMDGDGLWYWFSHRPFFDDELNGWAMDENAPDDAAYDLASEQQDESGIDWDFAYATLEERPTKN